MTPEKRATLVSTSVAALLTLIKLFIGLASGSVAVLASAIDSILDMFVSIFNYFAISNSEKPADDKFNYGRGKIEALASLLEGVIITFSGLYLLYQAYNKAINGEVSSYANESILIMLISLFITISLVIYLNKVAKKTNSMVIKADSLHYKTDVYTNIAVLLSLILVHFTKYEIIDVFIGGAISIFIIYSAYELIEDGVLILLDKAIEEEVVLLIKKEIISQKEVNTFHMLKTRQSANKNFLDVHLVYDCFITLLEAHNASDEIENRIKKIDTKKEWIITIHMDPYDDFKIDKEKKESK